MKQKLSLSLFILGILNLVSVAFAYALCRSNVGNYCDAFAFGIIWYVVGIPTLLVVLLSYICSKINNVTVRNILGTLGIIIGLVAFGIMIAGIVNA